MTTPFSTPRPIGPQSAISAKTNSIRLMRQISRSAARSIRLSAAATRMAPSAGIGRMRSAGAEKEERRDQRRRGDDAGDLRAAADGQVDRGARVRGGDREGAEEPGGDVGGAEADQLAVRVDRVAAARAEAAGGDDAGAEADEEDRGGAEQDACRAAAPPARGRVERGRPVGTSPTTAIPCACEVEERRERAPRAPRRSPARAPEAGRAAPPGARANIADAERERGPVDQTGLAATARRAGRSSPPASILTPRDAGRSGRS